MKLDPVTVTFAGVTLTEEPHGVADQQLTGQAVLDVFAYSGDAASQAHQRGGDTMPLSFQVVRQFASPAAAGHFARTHYATLKAATTGRGNLDFVGASGTSRMVDAALQSASVSGPFEYNRVRIAYTFIGPPIVAVA